VAGLVTAVPEAHPEKLTMSLLAAKASQLFLCATVAGTAGIYVW